MDVKYDMVTQLLYKEMLEEHYSKEKRASLLSQYNTDNSLMTKDGFGGGGAAPSTWEGMLPWQQQKEEEELEDLAEDALESGDMVCLAELPGAFRIYR